MIKSEKEERQKVASEPLENNTEPLIQPLIDRVLSCWDY